MKPWHSLSVEDVARELGTDVTRGLSWEEARRRLGLHGPNEIAVRRRPVYMMYLDQFKSFLILVLVAASSVSLALGEHKEALAIFAVVLLMGTAGFVQRYRAERTLEALRRMAAPRCVVVREGVEREVPSSELVPGDVVVLRAGDLVPADVRLVEAMDLEVDESPLTGESTPVEKNPDAILEEGTPIVGRVNMAYMGTSVLRGKGRGLVVATGMRTELGRLARAVAEIKEERTPLERELDYFAKRIAAVVVGIVALVFASSVALGLGGLAESLMVSVALAVAAIPEGLPAVATVILAVGAYRMARKNALIKRLAAVESLGGVDVVCVDKTGTLTRGEMEVEVIALAGSLYRLRREGRRVELVLEEGREEHSSIRLLLRLLPAHVGEDARVAEEGGRVVVRGSPTEGAVLAACHRLMGPGWLEESRGSLPTVAVYPFDRFRKRKTTVHASNEGYLVISSGAPEVLIEASSAVHLGDEEVPLDEGLRVRLERLVERLGSMGYRTYGVAYRRLDGYREGVQADEIERGLTFLALFGMIDPPREGVAEAVATARRAGIRVVMVTGDHRSTALAIAKQIGLDTNGLVLEGRELDKMGDEELASVVDRVTVFARVTPEHKARIVRVLKSKGYRVAMTGDGVNDAPALKLADVGVAMGIRGTEVAKEASQMVLMDDNFVTIVEAVREGRVVFENLKKTVNFVLSINMSEIATIFGAELASLLGRVKLPLPLTPLQILWVNLVTESAPAASLGLEPPEPDVMERPPRRSWDRLITLRKLLYYVLMGSVIGALTLSLYTGTLRVGGLQPARSLAFTSLVISEVGLVLAMRSETKPFWRLPFNRWIPPALLLAVCLQALALSPPLSRVLGTVPLTLEQWLLAMLVPAAVLLVDLIRKSAGVRL